MTIDFEAEQYVVGSQLQGTRVRIELADFWCEGCRTASLACSVLQAHGYYFLPASSSPAARHEATAGNIAVTASAMAGAGLWTIPVEPHWFLSCCVVASTVPQLAPRYVDRIRLAAQQRRMLDQIEQASRHLQRRDVDAVQRLLMEVAE